MLEAEAHRRAVEGVVEPVFQGGEKVGEVRRYSDSLLMFLLRARRPQAFSDKHRNEHEQPTSFILSPKGQHSGGQGITLTELIAMADEYEAGVDEERSHSGS